jgi:copper transport protein
MAVAEPLIHWPQPLIEYAGFLASFLATGAVGFRYTALRRLRAEGSGAPGAVADGAAARAAALGLAAAILAFLLLAFRLPGLAARRHLPIIPFLTSTPPVAVQVALALLALLGFATAHRRWKPGWPLAAAAVVAGALRPAFFGQWTRLVNPVHVLAGGLWIGTLLVLVVAGLPAALRAEVPERRGALVAGMVAAFSPLALTAAGVLALFGVITARLHLKAWAALWTTPYGLALIVKLCLVLAVAGIGAWNWRRQKPRLGDVEAALALRRSARFELLAAALVLAVTAILVSLPTPGPPGS